MAYAIAGIANAQTLINGNFTETNAITPVGGNTNPASAGGGQLGYSIAATGWTVPTVHPGNTLDFLMVPSLAGSTGVPSYYNSHFALWSTNNGGLDTITAPPGGGNMVAADGDPTFSGPISQTITGLTIGNQYAVSFEWAAAQQSGQGSAGSYTTEKWAVSFGGSSNTTTTYTNPYSGFSGWMATNFTYTATNTSELLQFLAKGTPSGVPPVSLLADVSFNVVPEPTSMGYGVTLMVIALTIFVIRKTRNNKSPRV